MLKLLKLIFIWWDTATLGTLLFTRRKGMLVGEDEQGNRYYRDREDRHRWVIYNGLAEASRVPPEWHGWLHHMWKKPPTEEPPRHPAWEKPHLPNLTGTADTHVPAGSLFRLEPKDYRDYEAWQPE